MQTELSPEQLVSRAKELAAEVDELNRRAKVLGEVKELITAVGFRPSRGSALMAAGRHYITMATKVQDAVAGPAGDMEAMMAAVNVLPQLRARGAKLDALLAQVKAELARRPGMRHG
jgi:hypothetical protein